MSIKQLIKMEFNDIANVGETHRTHCDCNALHRHVHKCAYASATGTVSAWYKTCIAVSMSVPVHLLQAQCPHGIRPVSHVHKCACASATGTVSAWYKTCITCACASATGTVSAWYKTSITFSIKTNWTASRGRR